MKADYFFESSWEVCNKVGGIYTVVKSKSRAMKEHYGDSFFTVGPYFHEKAAGEFVEELPPENLKKVFNSLSKEGIECHFGRWLIESEPRCILIDFSNFAVQKDRIKGELWEYYKIDSLNSKYFDFDEPVVWSYAVGMLLEKFSQVEKKKIVAQFHEWLSGAALLYIKARKAKVGTVFTTHATMLGRTLASADKDLYGSLENIDPIKEAYNHGIQAKHMTEQQAAKNADVFTTVSEITSIEAGKILGRKPDVILPNGLDINKFPSVEEMSIQHNLYKNKIKEFLQYYFFPYYPFDLDNTLIYFICGRYEFHDKGIDVYIKALSELNKRLIKERSKKTIVAFFWVPGGIRGVQGKLLENKTRYKDVKDLIDDKSEEIKQRMIYNKLSQKNINEQTIFDKDFRTEMKKKLLKFNKDGKPPLVTHNLFEGENDQILKSLKENNLTNDEKDKVKVVFYSVYLTGADGLLDTSYYESMQGSHFGVFPSYYEPWGYTPLEAAALGVGSVTTDLAGFGRYLNSNFKPKDPPGIFVLPRMKKSYEQVVKELTDVMHNFSKYSKEKRIQNKLAARELAGSADWKKLSQNYIKAHNMAIKWN